MERVPLNEVDGWSCPNCGNYRTLGFLYACRQEHDINYLESLHAEDSNAETSDKSSLRQELEHIGLSESVIRSTEQGCFTVEQLVKLKDAKTNLNRIVRDTRETARIKSEILGVPAYAQSPPNTDGAFTSLVEMQPELVPTCQLVACHKCRPYFRDRISMSFEAVFDDEIRPFHPAEAGFLPVKPSSIWRDITPFPTRAALSINMDVVTPSTLLAVSAGFSDDSFDSPSQSSMLTYKTTQSEIDTLELTRRHRRRFYKMGHRTSDEIQRDLAYQLPLFTRQGLKEAFKGVFRTARESSSSGSNITLPMPCTASARDSDDVSTMGEFDMSALHRVKRQKERYDLRHVSEHGTCSDSYELPFGVAHQPNPSADGGDSDSSGSILSVYSCLSEGSEIEVAGGVALTEEAVETQRPDIINDPLDLDDIMKQV